MSLIDLLINCCQLCEVILGRLTIAGRSSILNVSFFCDTSYIMVFYLYFCTVVSGLIISAIFNSSFSDCLTMNI